MLVERNQTQKSTHHKVSFLFHLYKILDNVNQTIGTESRSVSCLMTGCGDAGAGTGWRDYNGTQEGWQRYEYEPYLDCADGFRGVYMCQNLSNVHLKYMPFTTCKLFLIKTLIFVNVCCYLPQK